MEVTFMAEFETYSATGTRTNYFARIFGWVFAALGLTALVATGVYFLLASAALSVDQYYGLLIGSSIAYFILVIIIQIRIFRSRFRGKDKSIKVPFLLYSVVMGITLSTYLIYYDVPLLLTAFGITALCFGSMALYGALTKHNLNVMGSIAFGAIFGAMMLSLVYMIMYWVSGTMVSEIYWIISFVMFGAVMLITAYETWQMKNEIILGTMTNHVAMYYAFRLYVDFIYLFVRIVGFLSAGRRR
jgi:uncharacterized protein